MINYFNYRYVQDAQTEDGDPFEGYRLFFTVNANGYPSVGTPLFELTLLDANKAVIDTFTAEVNEFTFSNNGDDLACAEIYLNLVDITL